MSKAKTMFIYYGTDLFTAPEITAISKHDIVNLAPQANFAANAAALRAANPNCKVIMYILSADAVYPNSCQPIAWLQQVSIENWLYRQNPASSPTTPLLSSYQSATKAGSFATNATKVGGMSGKRPGRWYVENIVPTLSGIGAADGFFYDVVSLGPVLKYASTVDAAWSGTCTAGTGASSVVDSGKAWVVNSSSRRLVRMTSGAAAGKVNWVLSNTGTTLSLVFPFSPAPASGDTYETYLYSSSLAPVSGVECDYTETASPANLDDLEWKKQIASAAREQLDALIAAYPGKIIIVNEGRGWDCPEVRGLPRDIVGVFFEGAINSSYQVYWAAAMSQMQCITRRLAPFSTVNGVIASNTDYVPARYTMAAALMADCHHHLQIGGTLSSTTTLYLDEYAVDLGEPASDTSRNANGTYSREFTQAYVVANPTDGTVVVPVPTGFRRILASDYTNQDPTLNDGSTNAVSLLTKTAVMFVRV